MPLPVDESFSPPASDQLILSLRLDDRVCLVVGGGRVAQTRSPRLIRAGAQVRVVAPNIGDSLLNSKADCHQRPFRDSDLDDCVLVVVATDDDGLNRRICQLARQRRIWVNAAFDAKAGDVVFPASVRRGDLCISVTTNGRSPALSSYLAHDIAVRYGPRWSEIADSLARWRQAIARTLTDRARISAFCHRMLGGSFVELILGGQRQQAEAHLRAELSRAAHPDGQAKACVYLVGAGPGDQRLLTLKAFDLLQRADIVLYDRLVSAEILACIPGHVDKVNVGKESQRPALGQKPINQLMVELATAGRTVVRLKGGDPFIFGRGGEEIVELARSGIDFQVIPGISAANGCACYYGIPLTHRDYAHSCLLMTAHRRSGSEEIDWSSLVQPKQTLVLYMGNYRLAEVAQRLKEAGFPGSRPLALISCGTTTSEKTWVGSLDEVIECTPKLPSPALAIVGEVVRLSRLLDWRDRPGKMMTLPDSQE